MRRIDRFVVLAAVALTLLFYPQTFLIAWHAAEDTCMAVELERFEREVSPAYAPDMNRTTVVFMFDDGWESVYTVAYPLLRSYGYCASVSVIPSLVADSEYMSYLQLGELYLKGWDMLNHTFAHQENMYEDCQGQLMEFQRARDWMNKKRMPRGASTAICPYGEGNPYLIQLLMKNGYGSVRTSDNILLLDKRVNKYLPVTTLTPSQSDSMEELQAVLLTSAKKAMPVLIIIHKLGDAPDANGMTIHPGQLAELLRFINEQSSVFQVLPYTSLLSDEAI